jgi:CubicO group peptidase (beta-lactamase class C family)
MKQTLFLIFTAILFSFNSRSQNLYFPPIGGNVWDTISPQSLNWCQPRIDSLYNYLQVKNTKSFIILKNGKIALEKYFGTYTADSTWYWASAGKTLAAFITGVAQQKGFININNVASQYIGQSWSNAPLVKESMITVKDFLQMTSGLDDSPPFPCTPEDTAKSCLNYLADAGTRWGYHSGPYKKVQDVVSIATGSVYNQVTTNWVKNKIGLDGFWFQQVYYSKARGMARFGLLNLNKGIWAADTVLKDSVYFNNMVNTSQNFNKSYGYLWWLNGKASTIFPGAQTVFPGPLIPNAPMDMYAGLGKNDQKIYVVPSQKMVVIRQGNAAEGVAAALSNFDNKLWDYINKLNCSTVGVDEAPKINREVKLYPNPSQGEVFIETSEVIKKILISTSLGETEIIIFQNNTFNLENHRPGLYFLTIELQNNICVNKIFILR